jgi:hypothetical protein
MPAFPYDLTNKVFGRLIAKEIVKWKPGRYKWKCICICGNEVTVSSNSLSMGHTQSCGCLQKERVSEYIKTHCVTHGDSDTPEHSAWMNMILRCDKDEHYINRGTKVCDEWRNNYLSFLSHIGRRPPNTSLNRIDNNGNYEPGNVRWATYKQQSQNRKSNLNYIIKDKTQCLKAWTEELGLIYAKTWKRIKRGWSIEEALELV